ncbi:hypothetical protein CDAR_477091 [Caerostris darwini]|uniref:Uncharacterized protein n=1 Tax=Caerostris darwini TaxID=1538125 RepID=A0AAV4V3F2_9ARAC|nr:hypothetical protein CDAR_477091 [Caerostris darwini]
MQLEKLQIPLFSKTLFQLFAHARAQVSTCNLIKCHYGFKNDNFSSKNRGVENKKQKKTALLYRKSHRLDAQIERLLETFAARVPKNLYLEDFKNHILSDNSHLLFTNL